MAKKPRLWPDLPARLPARVADNHTHLPIRPGEVVKDSSGRVLSVAEQAQLAESVGIGRMIVSACDLPEVQVVKENPRGWDEGAAAMIRWAVAIHPNEAALHAGIAEPSPDGLTPSFKDYHLQYDLDAAVAEVEAAIVAGGERVVAVGETGLDFYRTAAGAGVEAQKEAFARHIELAKQRDLPMQIHDRDAHAECFEVMERVGAPERTVFHCFSGDAEMAGVLAENGWYGSFAGNVTYPANANLAAALSVLPRELVLVETDAPYLTPVPWRGHPNASYVMVHTVKFIAEAWGVSVDEACRQLDENTTRVYGDW